MEYPIINVEAENEHFELSDCVINWIETRKTSANIKADNTKDNSLTGIDSEELLSNILIPRQHSGHHQLSAHGLAWNLVKMFCEKQGGNLNESLSKIIPSEKLSDFQRQHDHHHHHHNNLNKLIDSDSPSPKTNPSSPELANNYDSTSTPSRISIKSQLSNQTSEDSSSDNSCHVIKMRGNDKWAPPRAQIIFNIHEESNFRKTMQKQNYLCAGCGSKIDLELARRLVLYCHYLGKYFCKCCFSHKAIHLPGYILQKWDFHKYAVSHFALQLLDKIANEPLFNINDINSNLYRKVRKLKQLIDIRMQLYYLKIYISTCTQTDKLNGEYMTFCHQHLLQDDVHLYSLNNLIEIQHGKLYEYLNDLVSRSVAHIAQCDRCRAKGHYCQLCGPSSLISSMMSSCNTNQITKLKHSFSLGHNLSMADQSVTGGALSPTTTSPPPPVLPPTPLVTNTNDHQLIFPFEIGRVAQCRGCGCCFHLQCFLDAGQNCPKCERIQRRKAETVTFTGSGSFGGGGGGGGGSGGSGGSGLDSAGANSNTDQLDQRSESKIKTTH